jgi:hypothetical protein
MYRTTPAFHTQNMVAIFQIKISLVARKFPVYRAVSHIA